MGTFNAKIIILSIVFLSILIRLVNITQSLWLDEASQAQMSNMTIREIWINRSFDFHPPLFYFITHYWQKINTNEYWLRLPSVIFGVLNVYVVYLLSKKIISNSKIYQFLSTLFFALNPYHVYYSQEYRSYSLLCFLGTLSMYLLLSKQFMLLAIVNSLLLYTHYSSVFLIVSQIIIILLYNRKELSQFITSILASLILYIPWIPQLLQQLKLGISVDNYLPGWGNLLNVSFLKAFPLVFFKLVAGRINFLSSTTYLIYIIFVLSVILLSFRFLRAEKYFLIIWAILPLIVMILVSFVIPQTQPFRVIFIIPALTLIFAQASLKYPKLFITMFIYIFLVGNLAYFTRPRLQREQWRQSLSYLTQMTNEKSLIIVKFSDKFSPIYWYAPNLKVISPIPKFPAEIDQVTKNLSFISTSNYQDLYLYDYLGELTDPKRYVDLTLENLGFQRLGTKNFEGVGFIHHYHRI